MDDALYVQHDILEEDHWWFVGRRRIVDSVLRSFHSQEARQSRLLDLGCGTGGMLKVLRELGEAVGMDTSRFAIDRARERSGCRVEWGLLPEPIPFDPASFDVATALDVIEHIDDDRTALRVIHGLLKPGGLFVCTVPAFQFLWSGHDEVNHHRRRYRKAELQRKLSDAGFQIRKLTYFNFLLFVPIALIRLAGRPFGRSGSDLGAPPRGFNRMLGWIFGAERHLLGRTSLPFGVSLLAVAQKAPAPD